MTLFKDIAVQTDIYGADDDEEKNRLFSKALDFCNNKKRTDSSKFQFVTSESVTFTISNVESVDLDGVPVVEFTLSECQDSNVFSQIQGLETLNDEDDSEHDKAAKGKFRCPHCHKEYAKKWTYNKHIKTHKEERDIAKATQIVKDNITMLSQDTPTKDLPADKDQTQRTRIKKKPFKKKRDLYECNHCSEGFSRKTDYTKHVKNHNKEAKTKKSHICPYCNVEFKYSNKLISHIRTHTKEKPFKCEQCDKAFGTKNAVMIHTRRHNNDKPFKCDHCGKGFVKKSILSVHMRIHTGERPYKCTFCPKTFVQKNALVDHLRIHSGERPFTCNVCNQSFRTNNVLKVHYVTHTGIKPHLCDICGNRFVKKFLLDQHRRSHTGEKPFKCSYCEQTFKRSFNWRNHEKKHATDLTDGKSAEEKPFKCSYCNQTFNKSFNCKRHEKRHMTALNNEPFFASETGIACNEIVKQNVFQ